MSEKDKGTSWQWWQTMLLIVLIGLKLGAVIDWSWWWVTAPFWVPLSIAVVCALVVGVITIIEKRNLSD